MDTTTPQGEFLFHIFGALAQFERSLIQERVQAGLAAARRRGRRGGRPPAIDAEKLAAVIAALDSGATKAASSWWASAFPGSGFGRLLAAHRESVRWSISLHDGIASRGRT